MSSDGIPWRSGAAEFDEVGMSLIKRDIEVLMLAVQTLAKAVNYQFDGNNSTGGVPTPAGAAGGTIPTSPGGVPMSIITVQACVDGVTKTVHIYGYVVP